MKGIADTGFLVAYLRGNDQHHDWAVSLADRIHEPLLTCDAVLAETAFHVKSSALVLGLIEFSLVTPAFDLKENLPHLTALADRYAEREPDLADLCLIRMSELFPKHSVITVDRDDFRIYRRNKRDMIPLICPP